MKATYVKPVVEILDFCTEAIATVTDEWEGVDPDFASGVWGEVG